MNGKLYLKQKRNKFPKSVLAFYIRVYCKQKGSSKTKYQNNLLEAIKSWLSLTEEEKQQINKKYKESELKFKQHCFNQLKNAEPFMKIKDSTGLTDVELNCGDSDSTGPYESIEASSQTDAEHSEVIENNVDITIDCQEHLVKSSDPQQQEENEITGEPINTNHTTRTFLVEPLPPTLKSGKYLFHMLNSSDEANNISWTALPKIERNQYSRAVLLLKKDYINKYKEYLESFTPRELFDYYNKTIF